MTRQGTGKPRAGGELMSDGCGLRNEATAVRRRKRQRLVQIGAGTQLRMGEEEGREKTAEELEREESQATRAKEPDFHALDALEREAAPLQEGETIDLPFGPLPVRTLRAIGVMLFVAVVLYFVFWGIFGTLGLLVGWLPAAALGFLAARELGRRSAL